MVAFAAPWPCTEENAIHVVNQALRMLITMEQAMIQAKAAGLWLHLTELAVTVGEFKSAAAEDGLLNVPQIAELFARIERITDINVVVVQAESLDDILQFLKQK